MWVLLSLCVSLLQLPAANIVNDGTTSNDNRLGACRDIQFVIEVRQTTTALHRCCCTDTVRLHRCVVADGPAAALLVLSRGALLSNGSWTTI